MTDEDVPLSGLSYEQLEQAVAKGFEELLQGDVATGVLTGNELKTAAELARDKYTTDEWTVRRNLGNAVELVR
jgi:lipoate-protein ligase A